MVHEFGSFAVNEERREVLGPEGVRHVEPKVFDLIAFLIANRGRVVSKGELIAAVWDDRIISDAAIASAVNAARRALGDDGRRQTVIRTAHGRGFRFLAEPLSASRGTSDRPASGGIARIRLDEIVAADPRSQCGTHRMLTAGIAAELACFPGISVLRASPDGAGGVGGSIDIEAQEAAHTGQRPTH